MPCDFFTEAILPYLKPAQIDGMRFHNKELNKLIHRKRVDLPRKPIFQIKIEGPQLILHGILNDRVKYKVVNSNYMVHVEHLEPSRLVLIGDVKYDHLDVRWLKTVDFIKFDKIPESMTAEDFYRIIQKFNSPNLQIFNKTLKLDACKILESMPNLSLLEIRYATLIPATFHENVIRKSKIGNGIQNITLVNEKTEPFEVKQFLNILENAKFEVLDPFFDSQNSGQKFRNIYIHYVTGTKDQFVEELNKLTRKLGWSWAFYSYFAHQFEINTPFFRLYLKIQKFIERL